MRELRATSSEVSDAYVRRHAAGGQSGTREDRAGQGHKNTLLRAVGREQSVMGCLAMTGGILSHALQRLRRSATSGLWSLLAMTLKGRLSMTLKGTP